jgi:hypothetical protein
MDYSKYNHPLYTTWVMMRQRCENPNAVGYKNYGARGIKVCDRWQDFTLFVSDMGMRPSDNHSIDRYPDKNGNYEPGNCRWASAKEQQRNLRSNRIIEYNGKKLSVCEWSEETGLSYWLINRRLILGWAPERIFNEAIRDKERYFEHDGKRLTLKQWSETLGVGTATLNTRIYKGWPPHKIFSAEKLKSGKCHTA